MTLPTFWYCCFLYLTVLVWKSTVLIDWRKANSFLCLEKGKSFYFLEEDEFISMFEERRIYFNAWRNANDFIVWRKTNLFLNAWRKANSSLCLGKGELILMFGERRICFNV